jgi:hypothetical protein
MVTGDPLNMEIYGQVPKNDIQYGNNYMSHRKFRAGSASILECCFQGSQGVSIVVNM